MATLERFEKFKEISRANVEKVVKLGLVFRDIAEKEAISVEEKEIQEQIDLLTAQAKQKGEAPPDPLSARYFEQSGCPSSVLLTFWHFRDEIENALLRRKVFDKLASYASITWVVDETQQPQPASK